MRTARLNIPGVVYHVISRFVDHTWFLSDDEERQYFLHLFGRSIAASDWQCLAYALMSNHIHLAVVAGEDTLASWAKPTNATFAQWLNRRQGRLGPVFAGRPSDYAVLPHNEGNLIAYIHNNPVRAGVVARASDSTWTSHSSYLSSSCPSWLDVAQGLQRAGFDDGRRFDAWVQRTPGESGEVALDATRRAVRRRGRLLLGTPTNSEPPVIPIVTRPFARIRPDLRNLVAIAAELVGISEARICSGQRTPAGLVARRAIVFSGQAMGATASDLAALLGMSVQGVCRILRRSLTQHERETARAIHLCMQRDLDRRAALRGG